MGNSDHHRAPRFPSPSVFGVEDTVALGGHSGSPRLTFVFGIELAGRAQVAPAFGTPLQCGRRKRLVGTS